jgi:hypothetical protein
MLPFDGSAKNRNDSSESFIRENLSRSQGRWLQRQSDALRKTKSDLLDTILIEWFAHNPPDVWEALDEIEIGRRAVEEFIMRHHSEFL